MDPEREVADGEAVEGEPFEGEPFEGEPAEVVEGEPAGAGSEEELPVVVEARVLERRARPLTRGPAPSVTTAVAAATGFVAGAATFALLRRYGGRAAARAAVREPDPVGESVEQWRRPYRQTTTYLVQVRTIERRVE